MACAGCARRREKMRRAFVAAKEKLGFASAPAAEPPKEPAPDEPAVGHAINREGRVTRVVRVQ